jgi:hypothetical protein
LRPFRDARCREATVDIDRAVTPLFGEQDSALVGYDPRYQGRRRLFLATLTWLATSVVLWALVFRLRR